MCVAAQHFPIFVPSDQRYLFNCESSFKQAARAFVPQVVKMKVADVEFTATSTEGGTDRPVIKWENSIIVIASPCALLLDDGPCIVSSCREQRDTLIVALLVARVFPVADEKHPRALLHVGPKSLANFLLAHRGCDREANNLANRRYLERICIEVSD
jgi:hypothetical protein